MLQFDDVLVARLCTDYAKPSDLDQARKDDLVEAARRMYAVGTLPNVIARRLHRNQETITAWIAQHGWNEQAAA